VKPLWRYRNFCYFQDGGRRHLGFSKIPNFNGQSAVSGVCVDMPNFIKIAQTVAEMWQFNGFQNGGRSPFLFVKFNFLTAGAVMRPILHKQKNFVKIGQTVAEISRFL